MNVFHADISYFYKFDKEVRLILQYKRSLIVISHKFNGITYSTVEGRVELLKINLKGVPQNPNMDLKAIAENLNGYSGADITNVCR